MHFVSDSDYKQFKHWQSTLRNSPETTPKLSETTPRRLQGSPESLKCNICGRRCKTAAILAHHLKSHVTGYQCNICKKVFQHMRTLKSHLKGHPPQAIPPAPLGAAPAPLDAVPAPPSHRHDAAMTPQLQCEVCGKKITHKRNLYRHMQSHKLFKADVKNWITL